MLSIGICSTSAELKITRDRTNTSEHKSRQGINCWIIIFKDKVKNIGDIGT